MVDCRSSGVIEAIFRFDFFDNFTIILPSSVYLLQSIKLKSIVLDGVSQDRLSLFQFLGQ